MRVTLKNRDGTTIEYDPDRGGLSPITTPCFQCGTCCSKWQAPVDSQEILTISNQLSIPLGLFQAQYLRRYPMSLDLYLINHKDGACVFLTREARRAYCSIHDFKPEACRNWTASLARKECREGLGRLGRASKLLNVEDLNLAADMVPGFCESLRRSARYSIMRGQKELADNE